jgi:NADPH2:quinone reductase
MRAVICHQFGPPESLVIGEVPCPQIRPNEVRIRVWAAGINFPDTLIIKGEYQLKPPMPFTPGFEVAGEIVELGAEVRNHAVGDRVMALTSSGCGAFAQEVAARAAEVVLIPGGIDYATATSLYTAYGTSYHALVQRGALRPGETLVVLGASGGVGLAAVEIGKALGARVIAVGRSEERLNVAIEKGADHAVSYADGDLRKRILELTDGRGADVCIDMLGGTPFHEMSRAMNWNGRLLVVGFTTGEIPKVPVNLALLKGYQIVGVYWGAFIVRDPAANAANFHELARLIGDGRICPHIAGRYSLDEVPQALQRMLSRETTGKLVVDVVEG